MAKQPEPAKQAKEAKPWKPPVALPTISLVRYTPDSRLVQRALGNVKEDDGDVRQSEPGRC